MPRKYKILVADDEIGICELLTYALSGEYDVSTSMSGSETLEKLRSGSFDILVLDLSFPDMDGIEILETIREHGIKIHTIVISASSDIERAITTMKLGAYDYIIKPVNLERIKLITRNLSERLNLETELIELRKKVTEDRKFSTIIAESDAMNKIFGILSKVVDTDITITIQGESGTGKGMLASAIHYSSNRSAFPFRTLDCSTIPRELIESELFGHEKGAFTGANARKAGKFELADGGTLFIDEISNLSLEVQAKLLKVLQEKQFERLGGSEVISVKTRIIVASNRDLRLMVKSGEFREDLYYRLNIFPVYIPRLAERKTDIPVLCSYFLTRFNSEYGTNVAFQNDAINFLVSYSWPGNVRQLENVIRRVVLLSDNSEVDEANLVRFFDPDVEEDHPAPAVRSEKKQHIVRDYKKQTLADIEKEAIIASIENNNFNLSLAATELGISRKSIYNKIERYGITIGKRLITE